MPTISPQPPDDSGEAARPDDGTIVPHVYLGAKTTTTRISYQACPVCRGTGCVSRPPGVAADQTTWVSTSAGPFPCRPCDGSGLLAVVERGE